MTADLKKQLAVLEQKAKRFEFPCGDGILPIRHWSNADAEVESVVLLHGGSGSWMHWYRNIEVLQREFQVYAIDLPGLGDAGMLETSSAVESAEVTATALDELMTRPYHIVAFSWGCTVTAMNMRRLSGQLKSVMLTGPAAVGDLPRRQTMKPLIKRTPDMSVEEIAATHKENLARLMIYGREEIDEMAVLIQTINLEKARFSSPQYARSTLILEGLQGTTTPLYVIYGDHDAPAEPPARKAR